jgi:hypothetical protein
MAPHDTNIEREKKRHAGPLIGLAVIVILALLGLIWLFGWVATEPGGENAEPEVSLLEPAVQEPPLLPIRV